MPYSLNQGNHQPLNVTIYTIKFFPTNAIPSTGSIQLTYPPHIGLVAGESCVVVTSRAFPDACVVQAAANATDGEAGGVITITNVFADQAAWTDEVTFKMAFENPVNNAPQELGFGIKTYADADTTYMIDYLTDADYRGLLIPHLDCTHPCESCAIGTPTLCESCW